MNRPTNALVGPTVTVGFRLGPQHIRLLQAGAERHGVSIHEYARRLLIGILDGRSTGEGEGEPPNFTPSAKGLGTGIDRATFAAATLTLLLAVRDPGSYTAEDAQVWVSENLCEDGGERGA